MATIKDAVGNAMQFAQNSLGDNRTIDLRLEEIDSTVTDGRDYWLITLSMYVPLSERMGVFKAAVGRSLDREYKTFTVDKATGETTSMKIREFASQ